MDNNELVNALEKTVFLSRNSPFQKIVKPRILFSRILDRIALCSRESFRVKARTFWGGEMTVIIPEVVSLNLYRYGFFEEGLTKMVLEYLKLGMTFFDVGAHFGYYTLLASFIVGKNGKIHAFEPTPSTFDILKGNASKIPKVAINNLAVASKRDKLLINDYGIRYSAYNSVYNARLSKNTISKLDLKRYEIQTISIDEYVEENKIKPDFIKIDAESSEYEILLGMKLTIEKFHPIITVEVGDYEVEGVPTCKKLIEFLIDKGYKPYEYKEGKILPHAPRNNYSYENILFLPKE
jgi:FkbM family methyltransferase